MILTAPAVISTGFNKNENFVHPCNKISFLSLDTVCSVHPVFYVSMFEPATPNKISNCVQSPPLPVEVQGELKYEISEVLDSKIDN